MPGRVSLIRESPSPAVTSSTSANMTAKGELFMREGVCNLGSVASGACFVRVSVWAGLLKRGHAAFDGTARAIWRKGLRHDRPEHFGLPILRVGKFGRIGNVALPGGAGRDEILAFDVLLNRGIGVAETAVIAGVCGGGDRPAGQGIRDDFGIV